MSPSDIIIATLFYQFSLYVCVRLARRGFTLGELAIVCNAATALTMETFNMTRMKVRLPSTRLKVDPPDSDTIHQDLPPSDSSPHLSTRPDSWLSTYRLSALPAALPLTPPRPAPRAPPSLPGREGPTSPASGNRLLRRQPHHLRWTRRDLDPVVSVLARPSALGDMVDDGRG